MTNEVGQNHGNVVQANTVGTVNVSSPEPPLPALDGLRHASRSFVGRERELAELDVAGLTVVSGLAGVGKTELVLRYAEKFPGGKLFVDLQDYDDERRVAPAQALEEFLTSLGVREIPRTEVARAALFRTLVADRDPMLIVIDNARSAHHVRPLLPNRHRTIVTSRHRLVGLDDAHHLELGLLSEQEATALVGDAELAELCGRLPLALRIMAALRHTDPGHDWVAELREVELDLLDDGDERSVRAAFALSYRALTEEQRRVFRLSALHPSHEVTTEGAAQLAGCAEAKARKVLRELRTAHLLEPGDRFHDLVRQFAADCVSQDEEKATRERAVTRFFTHFAERATRMNEALRTPKRAEALHWFDRHRPTLVASVLSAMLLRHLPRGGAIAEALHDYLFQRGHLDDLLLTDQLAVDAALNLGQSGSAAILKVRLGHSCLLAGDDERALRNLYDAWAVVRFSNDVPLMYYALGGLVPAFIRNGRHEDARKAALELDVLARMLTADPR
ncbi:ATP-binding protein [Lentzea sp. BCCO 10_0061]|uniref:ATP-binding protein n=1 Tax=Lentzea sokolovensis TaxID=3095429 RepID=A0ABU4V6F5_9PSEU|nr:ATP-binding protein [Lentzea sp. BCCO 10_0061]MDX8147060.1 ATP-binding protein [Lentzea sp. BCCO 10_0061]